MAEIMKPDGPHACLLAEPPEYAADIPRVERGADRGRGNEVPLVATPEVPRRQPLFDLAPRWRRSASQSIAGRMRTRRDARLFGGTSCGCFSIHCNWESTASVPRSRSTAPHVSPCASPWRRPRASATENSVPKRSSRVALRNHRASSISHGSITMRSRRGGSASAATFLTRDPHRTASLSAARSITRQ